MRTERVREREEGMWRKIGGGGGGRRRKRLKMNREEERRKGGGRDERELGEEKERGGGWGGGAGEEGAGKQTDRQTRDVAQSSQLQTMGVCDQTSVPTFQVSCGGRCI